METPLVSKFKQKSFKEAERLSDFWNYFTGFLISGVFIAVSARLILGEPGSYLENVLYLAFGNPIVVYVAIVSLVLALALKKAVERQQTNYIQFIVLIAFGPTLGVIFLWLRISYHSSLLLFQNFSIRAQQATDIIFLLGLVVALPVLAGLFLLSYSLVRTVIETFDRERIIVHYSDRILVRDYNDNYEIQVRETWVAQYERVFGVHYVSREDKMTRFKEYLLNNYMRIILLDGQYVGFYIITEGTALLYMAVQHGAERYGFGSVMLEDFAIMNELTYESKLLKAYVEESNILGQTFLEANDWQLDTEYRYFDRLIYFKVYS